MGSKYLEFNFRGEGVGASDISIETLYGKFSNISDDVINHSQLTHRNLWRDSLKLNWLSALPVK